MALFRQSVEKRGYLDDNDGTASHRHTLHSRQRFFFALFSCFRFLINLPLLDRPLTIGFIWGLLTGSWESSLGVSLFFELLWLDIFPAGTIIPPNSLAPSLASLAVMHQYAITQPALAAVVILASLPLGRLFAQIERYHRQYENEAYNRLMLWAKHPEKGKGPVFLTRRSILVMLPVNFVTFGLALSGLLALIQVLLPRLSPMLENIPIKWPHLWVVASIGAVLSLRHRPAYAILLGGVALAVLSRLII